MKTLKQNSGWVVTYKDGSKLTFGPEWSRKEVLDQVNRAKVRSIKRSNDKLTDSRAERTEYANK